MKITEVAHFFELLFSTVRYLHIQTYFDKKKCCATFWAILSQTHLVTLASKTRLTNKFLTANCDRYLLLEKLDDRRGVDVVDRGSVVADDSDSRDGRTGSELRFSLPWL
jgi:hypothetical protein